MESFKPPSRDASACRRQNVKWYLLAALFLANALIWYAVFSVSKNDILTVAFLDVGQGDAIFIEAPNGNQMLVDGGRGSRVLRELNEVMPFYDRSIDVVVATHPDEDHIGGLPHVFRRYDVDYYIESGVENDTAAYDSLARAAEAEGLLPRAARRGMSVALGGGVFLDILFPDRDATNMKSNDASIVAKLTYGDSSFLLTGDSPQKIEKYLAAVLGKDLDADVLKVGHHGSKTSSSDLLLGFASPAYAVISAGKDNRYGHPHSEVTERLADFGAEILETSGKGTVIFETNGQRLRAQ